MTRSARSYWFRDVPYPETRYVTNHAAAAEQLQPGMLMVVRPASKAKSIKLFCPCGCGEVLTINLLRASGKAWSLTTLREYRLSLFPSVWLDHGCKSHFILRNSIAHLLVGRLPEMSQEEQERWWHEVMDEQDPPLDGPGVDVRA